MELTASDVTQYGIGFDNETGYGIVNAKNALQLLAPPNVLYHYTSTGGTATKIASLPKWVILDGRWNLAAALYLNVDQYKITKHIDFTVPFCSAPKVWIRERECKSLDYANPNSGKPNAFIKNVTAVGFDLEYVAYYVGYDAAGRQINQWVPATPASTLVAYTVVGQPNLAALVTISGSSMVCNSTTFIASNNPNNFPVTWSSSNPSGLAINATTGVATRVNNFNGQVSVSASINSACGLAPVPPVTVWVGAPPADISTLIWTGGNRGVNPLQTGTGATYAFNVDPVPNTASYTWLVPFGFVANGRLPNFIKRCSFLYLKEC